MSYLKYTSYVYILFAVFFIYDGVVKLNEGKENATMSFIIAGLAVFMFFFRRKFGRKFSDRDKEQ
ncbi:hypothetical protein [Flavobacterium poyangense]|uniref:hypothetical protein n=1 Tax=Flavobacterium poyangense TaxID=2204302 RepID=UPI0014219117|nr:hypothetical protein [Flavobacterium sp. JXAS1]